MSSEGLSQDTMLGIVVAMSVAVIGTTVWLVVLVRKELSGSQSEEEDLVVVHHPLNEQPSGVFPSLRGASRAFIRPLSYAFTAISSGSNQTQSNRPTRRNQMAPSAPQVTTRNPMRRPTVQEDDRQRFTPPPPGLGHRVESEGLDYNAY